MTWQDWLAAALVKPRTMPQWLVVPVAWVMIAWGTVVCIVLTAALVAVTFGF